MSLREPTWRSFEDTNVLGDGSLLDEAENTVFEEMHWKIQISG